MFFINSTSFLVLLELLLFFDINVTSLIAYSDLDFKSTINYDLFNLFNDYSVVVLDSISFKANNIDNVSSLTMSPSAY